MCKQKIIAWQPVDGYPGEKPVFAGCILDDHSGLCKYEITVDWQTTVFRLKTNRTKYQIFLAWVKYRWLLFRFSRDRVEKSIIKADDKSGFGESRGF